MLLSEKIKYLIQQAGYKKPGAFYKELCKIHENEAIDRKTFYNLLRGEGHPYERTLFQIGTLLKVTNTELRQGTDQETQPLAESNDYISKYSYNDKAALYAYHVKAPFLPLKLHLKAGAQTSEDRDSPEAKESVKLVWVIVGKITLVVKYPSGEERHALHNGQLLTFDARNSHYFINNSKNNAIVHIIHSPAENNPLHTSS